MARTGCGSARIPLALVVGLTLGCSDTVDPPGVSPPWDVVSLLVTIDQVTVRPTIDTATVRYTFANRAPTAAALSRDDRCPRVAAAAVMNSVVYLLTPVCGVGSFTGDSVTQTLTIPANDTTTLEVPFTGVVSIGVPTRCALAGEVTLLALAVNGQDVSVVPVIAGGRVNAMTTTTVAATTAAPACQ